MTAAPPPGVATAWGLTTATGLVAISIAIGAFWSHHTVVPTPDGPAVINVEDAR